MTRSELLSGAERAGCKLETSTFKRWQREGLLPRAEQLYVRGERGSRSCYPPGTLRQLLAVCRLRQHERRFEELRFDAWWEGLWVESEALRRSLRAILDDPLEEIRAIRRECRNPHEAALRLVEQAQAGAGRSPVTRLLRHRTGGDENLLTAAVAVLTAAFGGEPLWEVPDVGLDEQEPQPHEMVAELLGFGRAADLLGVVPEPPDAREQLPRLRDAGLLEFEKPADVLIDASEPELERARVQAWSLAGFADVSRGLELRYGRDAAGFGVFSVLERRDARWYRAWLVRTALLLPQLAPPEYVASGAAALERSRRKAEAVVKIADEFPGYKPFLALDGPQRLASLPREEQEEVRRNIEDLLRERPRLAEAVGIRLE